MALQTEFHVRIRGTFILWHWLFIIPRDNLFEQEYYQTSFSQSALYQPQPQTQPYARLDQSKMLNILAHRKSSMYVSSTEDRSPVLSSSNDNFNFMSDSFQTLPNQPQNPFTPFVTSDDTKLIPLSDKNDTLYLKTHDNIFASTCRYWFSATCNRGLGILLFLLPMIIDSVSLCPSNSKFKRIYDCKISCCWTWYSP